jgi:Sel1 repeat
MLTGAPGILQKDRFKAETLFQSAASKGYLAAKINLAILMVSNGKGNEAFSIINDVKDQSHDAAVLYGLMKTHGIGVEQNLQEARSVFGRLSSDFALYNYSVFMFHGLGGEKNIIQAMSNFEKLSDTKRGLPFIAASKNIEYFRSISNRTEYGNSSPTLASSKSVANQVGAQNNIDSVASMLRCHMDGCSYVKFLKSYDEKIPSSNGGVLSKVAVRVVEKNYGYSSHKNGDYPKSIREARNIQWSNKLSVSYFICDKSFPAVISEVENHPSGNKFSTDYIAFLDVSGYNVSTIQEYIKACHSKDIDVENFSYNKEGYKSFLKRLGYDDYFGWGVANYSTKNSPDLQSALRTYLSDKQEASGV